MGRNNYSVDEVIELVQEEPNWVFVQAVRDEPRALTELARDIEQFNIHELSAAASTLKDVGVVGEEPYPDSKHKARYVVTEHGRRLLSGVKQQ